MVMFDVYIEMPAGAEPVKYELENKNFRVSRIMDTAYRYPTNYGFIPETLAQDNDELDVLVITPYPLLPCSLIECRAIGALRVTDQNGRDDKILAVPAPSVCIDYDDIHEWNDLPTMQTRVIRDFFAHYKDNDPARWAYVNGWKSADIAEGLIQEAREYYKTTKGKTQ